MPDILIVGAGIGGLTAALALAQRGFRVVVLEQAARLEEAGAGIQLSPNAVGVLLQLGLGEALRRCAVAPAELRVIDARSAAMLARASLGSAVERRYGAPYWLVHRGDLQSVLGEAVNANAQITVRLGVRVEDFALHRGGITVAGLAASGALEERGSALIGADGLWSRLRQRLGHTDAVTFAGYTAWRALAPADSAAADLRTSAVNLWLGREAHLVHYAVRGGGLTNVVAIARDDWRQPGWNAPAGREEVLARFEAGLWPPPARAILTAPAQWHKWALCDRVAFGRWGSGPVTLLGDAAHPMLPYLAQGAAMAIEDAHVLARRLAENPDDPAAAMRCYEDERRRRTWRTQRAARRNGMVYHLGGAWLRALAAVALRGDRLITRYDWLYGWKPG